MFSARQIRILTGLMMMGATSSAYAADACSLTSDVSTLESDLESLSDSPANDGTDSEYGPRLASVTKTIEKATQGLAALVKSSSSLEAKLDAIEKKLGKANPSPTQGTGATEEPCTPTGNFLLECSSVVMPGTTVDPGQIIIGTIDIDLGAGLPTAKPVNPELVSYVEALGDDPKATFGICNSDWAPLTGEEYAGEWTREPALRVATKIKLDAAGIKARLSELAANPPLSAEDQSNPAAVADAKAAYALALQGIDALSAASVEDAAKFIHAHSMPGGREGVWRYLYNLEQAAMLVEGVRGGTTGWSDKKRASFELTKKNLEDHLKRRTERIRATAYAMNQEWHATNNGQQMLLVDLFKTPDYPDIIDLATRQVDEEARGELPPDVLRVLAGTGAAALPFAAVGATALFSAGVSAAVAGGVKAGLYFGLATLTATTSAGGATVVGGGVVGAAGTVAVIAFPVTVAIVAVTFAIVAGKDAWATKANQDKYDEWMEKHDDAYAIGALSDDAITAAYIDYMLSWFPQYGVGIGMGCK